MTDLDLGCLRRAKSLSCSINYTGVTVADPKGSQGLKCPLLPLLWQDLPIFWTWFAPFILENPSLLLFVFVCLFFALFIVFACLPVCICCLDIFGLVPLSLSPVKKHWIRHWVKGTFRCKTYRNNGLVSLR